MSLSREDGLAQQLREVEELLAAERALVRQLRQENKLLLKAARQIGYHVPAGATLRLADTDIGFLFLAPGGTLILEPTCRPQHIEEAPPVAGEGEQ